MLNINNKKRLLVSAFVAVAVILPAAIFAVGNLVRANNSFAASAAAEASGFEDDKLWYCVVYSYKNIGKTEGNYVTPSEDDYNTALDATQLGNIKNFMCTRWIATDTTDWTGLNQLKNVETATFGAQANMESFEPNKYFQNLEELYLYNDANLTTLNLAGATKLKQLHVVPASGDTGKLSSIQNLSVATSLVQLNANSERLTSIDLSRLSALEELNLANNLLTSVTLPTSCKLRALNVRDNPSLSSFSGNLNSCTNLLSVAIINDNFSNIDISGISGLKAIKAKGNPLKVIDISDNKELVNIQLDSDDYVVPEVAPTLGNNNNLIYDFDAFSFVRESSSHWTGYQAVFDGGNTNYAPSTSENKVTVYNYDNLPTVTGANSTYNNSYKYLRVTQQTSGVADTLIDNANWYDITNNTYRVIIEPADMDEYTLTFNSQGGSSVASKSCPAMAGGSCSVQIPANPTRTGYTFRGWADSASGNPQYQAGGSITLNSNKTVYAIWEQDAPEEVTYTLTFNSQGGSSVASKTCPTTAGGSCSVQIPANPTRTGYSFRGWADSASGNPQYQAGGSITLNGNKTVYAIWRENPDEETEFKISYRPNGGTNAPADTKCTGVGSCTAQVSPDQPIYDGYTFLGWSTDPTATEANPDYAPGKDVEISDNIILYAVWQANTPDDNGNFTLTFDPQGGTAVSPKSCSEPGPCTVTIPDAPTRDNYIFEGWATTPDGEPEYQPNDALTLDSSKTLYAIWRAADDGDNNDGDDGSHGVGTPNTGEMTDGGDGASAAYIIAGVMLAMALPAYLGVKNFKKVKFIKH